MVETGLPDWEGNACPEVDRARYRLAVRQRGTVVVDLIFEAASADEIWHHVARSARYIDPKFLHGAQIQVFDASGGIIVSVGARTALKFLADAKLATRAARPLPASPLKIPEPGTVFLPSFASGEHGQ